jgi:hypothetical protein
MSIVVKKVTEKNTKKQILEEYNNAVKLINELKLNLKKSTSSKPSSTSKTEKIEDNSSQKSISVDILVDNFNEFSNGLKEDMSQEVKIIEELKEQINKKINSIKSIYSSNSSIALGDLINSYETIIKEQDKNLSEQKKRNIEKIEDIKKNFNKEKSEYIESFLKKQNDFKLNSTRTDKSDAYAKTKAINAFTKERKELVENNKSILDDLRYEYKVLNKEAYKGIEEEQKEQSETISKAKSLKDKFEQSVTAKVTSVITKEKNSNAQEFKSMVQEYENKIKLKSTQLENFERENSLLDTQIEELLGELNTIQDKAHILASKTIDAKSSTQSFEAMKDVAMEQARGKK